MAVCTKGLRTPTLPKEARTVNTGAADGAADDWYQYSPWRAPGSAGVIDPCGVAGGYGGSVPMSERQREMFGIHFRNTSRARRGDFGSSLPRRDSGTVWRAGDIVEVSWTVNANHGGGYYWRLCRLGGDGSAVTEACFQQTPLQFVGNTTLRWNGDTATDEAIDNVFVSQGTHPPGSTWAMNPIPRNDTHQTMRSFAPKCKETCTGCAGGRGGDCAKCRCTGEFGPQNLEIVDRVALPWMLPGGNYVLGWRWDCEESNQVWQQCADVTIKPYDSNPGNTKHAAASSSARGSMTSSAAKRNRASSKARPKATRRLADFQAVPCPLPKRLCLGETSSPTASKDPLPLKQTLEYTRSLLQQAVMVEHSTIPLYLTALFSIINGSEYAANAIFSVAIEEMLHMAIAANVLNAVGGAPMIDGPDFIPMYPLSLPLTNVTVDIRKFDRTSISNFMLIESTTSKAKSIGAAYEYILSLLHYLSENYGESTIFSGNHSLQLEATASSGQKAPKIFGLADATRALLGVSDQGGGMPVVGKEQLWPKVSNISAGPLGGTLSHLARFGEIHAQRRYRPTDTTEQGPTGAAIRSDWDDVYDFEVNPKAGNFEVGSEAHRLSLAFASKYTALLAQMHNAFNGAPEMYYASLAVMHDLVGMAATLMATPDPRATGGDLGIGPPWEYVPAASQYEARGGQARPIIRD